MPLSVVPCDAFFGLDFNGLSRSMDAEPDTSSKPTPDTSQSPLSASSAFSTLTRCHGRTRDPRRDSTTSCASAALARSSRLERDEKSSGISALPVSSCGRLPSRRTFHDFRPVPPFSAHQGVPT